LEINVLEVLGKNIVVILKCLVIAPFILRGFTLTPATETQKHSLSAYGGRITVISLFTVVLCDFRRGGNRCLGGYNFNYAIIKLLDHKFEI